MDKIAALIENIQPLDDKMMAFTQQRLDSLTKPLGSLAALEDMAKQYCGATRELKPKLPRKKIMIMAADHGVAQEVVSHYSQEATARLMKKCIAGQTAINVLARHAGATIELADVGITENFSAEIPVWRQKIMLGTHNMRYGAAMTRQQAVAAINAGIEIAQKVIDQGAQAIGVGEMGIGNTVAAAAVAAQLLSQPVQAFAGEGEEHFVRVVKDSIAVNHPHSHDIMDVLAKVGGLEMAALTGLILACAARRTLVILDGLVTSVAALAAYKMTEKVRPYLIAAHLSAEPGHQLVLDALGLKPNLRLKMCLGEGTGAALGLTLLDAGIKILNEMATFEEAKVAIALADFNSPGTA